MANRKRGYGVVILIVMAMLLTAICLIGILSSCGSGVRTEDGITVFGNAWEQNSKACMEFGYPDHVTYSDDTVFCLRRTECSDEVVKLTTLQGREA